MKWMHRTYACTGDPALQLRAIKMHIGKKRGDKIKEENGIKTLVVML